MPRSTGPPRTPPTGCPPTRAGMRGPRAVPMGALRTRPATPAWDNRSMQHNPGFLQLVAEARRHIRECSIAEIKARLDRGEPFHFIDVREDSEFEVDHAA